jgi:hypothetical protein
MTTPQKARQEQSYHGFNKVLSDLGENYGSMRGTAQKTFNEVSIGITNTANYALKITGIQNVIDGINSVGKEVSKNVTNTTNSVLKATGVQGVIDGVTSARQAVIDGHNKGFEKAQPLAKAPTFTPN